MINSFIQCSFYDHNLLPHLDSNFLCSYLCSRQSTQKIRGLAEQKTAIILVAVAMIVMTIGQWDKLDQNLFLALVQLAILKCETLNQGIKLVEFEVINHWDLCHWLNRYCTPKYCLHQFKSTIVLHTQYVLTYIIMGR